MGNGPADKCCLLWHQLIMCCLLWVGYGVEVPFVVVSDCGIKYTGGVVVAVQLLKWPGH